MPFHTMEACADNMKVAEVSNYSSIVDITGK